MAKGIRSRSRYTGCTNKSRIAASEHAQKVTELTLAHGEANGQLRAIQGERDRLAVKGQRGSWSGTVRTDRWGIGPIC